MGKEGLVYAIGATIVEIAPSKLTSKLVYEKAADVEDWFPHVYGPVNFDAINKVTAI